jgi:sec-independent protein translocase protein TatA
VVGRGSPSHPRPIRHQRKDYNVFTGLLQPTHLIILLVVALVFLGPKRLPEAGRALGQGLKEFKHSISGEIEDHKLGAPGVTAPEEKAPSQ